MSFGWAPGPDDTAHLWGDYEYDFNADDDHFEPFRDPGFFHADCRYAKKRAFHSQQHADLGAGVIKAQVEYRGGTYQQLYPFRCPDSGDDEHFHLTHLEQS